MVNNTGVHYNGQSPMAVAQCTVRLAPPEVCAMEGQHLQGSVQGKVSTSRGLCKGVSTSRGLCRGVSTSRGLCNGGSAPPGVCAMEGRHLQGSVQWRVGTARGPCNGESAPPGVRAMESAPPGVCAMESAPPGL